MWFTGQNSAVYDPKLCGLRPLNCRLLMAGCGYANDGNATNRGRGTIVKINSPISEFRKRDCLYDK